MKMFAKLNLKKVHQAYLDVTALNFLAEVVCVACDNSRHTADSISVSETINRAAQINAKAISKMTGGSGLDYSTGISRLQEVADSFLRRFRSELGSEAEVSDLIGKCYELFYQVSEYIGQAIHKGYLDFSITDYQTLISSNEDRMKRAMEGTIARGDEYMESLQDDIDANRSDRENSDVLQNSRAKKSAAITEKSDRAVHDRAYYGEGKERKSNADIVEKSDRAVHGRAPLEIEFTDINDDLALSSEATEERYSQPVKITEAFDLISPSGALQADIGIHVPGGDSLLMFYAGDRPPLANFKIVATSEDEQTTISFELVAKIGSSLNTLGHYLARGIKVADSAETKIRVEVKVNPTTLSILCSENCLDSHLMLDKIS